MAMVTSIQNYKGNFDLIFDMMIDTCFQDTYARAPIGKLYEVAMLRIVKGCGGELEVLNTFLMG
jgi:hypothetical protein